MGAPFWLLRVLLSNSYCGSLTVCDDPHIHAFKAECNGNQEMTFLTVGDMEVYNAYVTKWHYPWDG